ncbi:MAG: porin [Alphaproteobacteria bacterium]|nr:porin [Alphaproteobacteria bacterium]
MFAQGPILSATAGTWRTVPFILGASAALVAAPALAAEVSSGNNEVSLTLSGQVNRALLWADDGTNSRMFHVDNANSSTRMNLLGTGRLNQDISVGAQIEVEIQSESSSAIDIEGNGGTAGFFTERKLELYFDHNRYGKLWLGQGDTASNGVSEVDLSGTTVVAYSSIADMAGGIEFGGIGGAAIGGVYSNMDGLGRDDRIRYDTPSFSGFTVSASNSDSAKYDVAARYSGSLDGGMKIAAAAGYAVDKNDIGIDSQISGSVSVLFNAGISVTGALGIQDLEGGGRDPAFLYFKLGYVRGANAFSVDAGQAEEIAAAGQDFTTVGVAYVRDFANAGTEIYIGARVHSLDTPGNPDDIYAVLAGARVKF